MNDDDLPIESRLRALGDAWNDSLDHRPLEPSGGRRAPSSRRLLAVAATALVVAGGAGIWAVSAGGDDGSDATGSHVESSPPPTMMPGGTITTVLATTNTVTPPPSPTTTYVTDQPFGPDSALAIGDAVMRGAVADLQGLGFVVQADEAMQVSSLVSSAAGLVGGLDPGVVVVHVGETGTVSASDAEALMDAVADVPRVVVLTLAGDEPWIASNNELIESLPAQYPNVVVLPWDSLAGLCPGECFASDGIHLAADGARYYAGLIALVAGVEAEEAPSVPPTTAPEATTSTVVIMACPDGSEPATYTVVTGDFQAGVAAKLDVELDDLEAANVGNPAWDMFIVGTELHVPCD